MTDLNRIFLDFFFLTNKCFGLLRTLKTVRKANQLSLKEHCCLHFDRMVNSVELLDVKKAMRHWGILNDNKREICM